MEGIKPVASNYETLFKGTSKLRSLLIPAFQRNYVWKKERIEDFIDSVIKNGPDLYAGNLMIMSAPNGSADDDYVVDGQQRLITISLILNYLKSDYSFENKEDILKFLFLEEEPRIRFKRKLVDKAFHEILLSKPSEGEVLEFRKIFNTASNVVARKFKDVDVNDFYEKLLQINFVIIKLPKEANVFSVFESLNSKNTPLTSVELIKNTLLGYSEDMHPRVSCEVEIEWESIQRNFEEKKRIKEFDTFLRYRSFSKYGHIYGSSVFPNLSKDEEVMSDPLRFTQDLGEDSKLWLSLREGVFIPSHKSQLDSLTEIPAYQQHFKSLNLVQVYSVIFYLHKALDKVEKYKRKDFFQNDLKKLLAFSVLAKIIGVGPQKYEKIYGKAAFAIANSVSEKQLNNARKEMFDSLTKLIKKDDKKKFVTNLTGRIIYHDHSGKKKITIFENSAFLSDLILWSQERDLSEKATIEHIIPKGKTWRENWPQIKSKRLDQRFILGNFTILKKDIANDGSFEDKLDIYATDAYGGTEINKKLLDKNDVHHKVFLQSKPGMGIEKRGKDMAGWIYDALISDLSKSCKIIK